MAPPAHAVARRTATRSAPRPTVPDQGRAPLRVIEPATHRRARRRRRPNMLAAVSLVVGSLVAVVVADDMVAQGQIRLSATQQQIASAVAEHKALQVSVAQLAAPPVVVTRAEGQLGMVSPAQIVDLPEVPLDVALPVPQTAPPAGAARPVATARASAPGTAPTTVTPAGVAGSTASTAASTTPSAHP